MNKRGLPQSVKMKHDLHYVEELFHDESGAVGRYIALNLIDPNPNQPRHNFGDLSELIASIKEKGVLEPLIVRPYGERYQLIAGERRFRACKELTIPFAPCIIKDVDDREMLELALIENMQRKDLTPFEEAEGLQALCEKFRYTHAQVAQVIGKSRTSVTEILSLNQLPSDIKEECRLADIQSKSLLLQIVRQPDMESMKKLLDRIKNENLTREQVRQEKKGEPGFIFRSKGDDYSLTIHFNKSDVEHDDIRKTLEDVLQNLSDTKEG